MKKNHLLAALVGLAALSSVPAYAESSYFSVGAGRSEYRAGGDSENQTALSLAYGQSLSDRLGYEIGYVNFGSFSDSYSGDGANGSVKFRAQSVYLAAVGTLPLSEDFSVYGKAGIAANYVKASVIFSDAEGSFSGTDSDTKFGPMLGLGAAYNITKTIAASVEYRYFHEVTDRGLKASALTAGLSYKF